MFLFVDLGDVFRILVIWVVEIMAVLKKDKFVICSILGGVNVFGFCFYLLYRYSGYYIGIVDVE